MNQDQIIETFIKLIYSEQHNSNIEDDYEQDRDIEDLILNMYPHVLDILSTDYKTYQNYISDILLCLEKNNTVSINYSLTVFWILYKNILESTDVYKIDVSIVDKDIGEDSMILFTKKLEEIFSKNNHLRISSFSFDDGDLYSDDAESIAAFIINFIQYKTNTIIWDEDLVKEVVIFLGPLRGVLKILNKLDIYYFIVGLFFDRLNTSEFYQSARDLCEEILIASCNCLGRL